MSVPLNPEIARHDTTRVRIEPNGTTGTSFGKPRIIATSIYSLPKLIESADADPDAYWNEQDRQTFVEEFGRVVLADIGNTLDPRRAIAALRGLPDGAGWDAVQRALHTY